MKERWSPHFQTFRGSAPPVEARVHSTNSVITTKHMFALADQVSDPCRRLSRSIGLKSQDSHVFCTLLCVYLSLYLHTDGLQAHTLSTIAECDWPDEYPSLLEDLVQLLSSGSSDAIHGSMQMFTDFVKSELTEDQLLPTLRQLLPILLNILGDQEVRFLPTFFYISHV